MNARGRERYAVVADTITLRGSRASAASQPTRRPTTSAALARRVERRSAGPSRRARVGVRAAPPRTMADDSVLSRFVEWFEREDIGATFDGFIADHASSFLGASAATEQRLEWTHLYNEYVALFDAKLQSFLEGAGTTQEAFLAEASTAEGLHDAYLQIFLAHAEYDTFIDLMAEQAEKQQS